MKSENHSGLTVVYQSPDSLKPNSKNARTHSKDQIRKISESIRVLGFVNPVLVDGTNTIVAGHGRVSAAKQLGIRKVPTIQLDSMSQEQIRAYAIADNRLAELAGWDRSILAIELQNLMTVDTTIDVTVTGFEVPEIDLILEEGTNQKQDEDDVFQIDDLTQPVTQFGDLWLLGRHRVLCNNSLDASSYKNLMVSKRAAVVFVDPPYNVPIEGHVCGNGSIHHDEFVMAAGEMNEAEFVAFLTTSLRLLVRHSTSGSVHFIFMDWRHMGELLAAGKQVYDSLLNLCVWTKNNGGMGSFYRSQHELVFVFKSGQGQYRNNVKLGKFGRNRSNVWQYPGINTLSKQGEEGNLLALHPTVKPVALVADALLDCSARGDIVLDSFLGSGTTLLAAERVGRVCFGIEINPRFVDVAIRRWQQHSGDRAIHAATHKCFDDVASSSEVRIGE